MKRTVWICEGCRKEDYPILQDEKCTFITMARFSERKPIVCPVAMEFNKRCDWKKISECEIPDETDAQYARE